jgi:hypothetical protein
VSGATVTFTAAGSCVIDANQAGTGGYAAAPQVQRTITVNGAPVSGIPQGQPKTPPPAQAQTPAPAQTPARTPALTQTQPPALTPAQTPALTQTQPPALTPAPASTPTATATPAPVTGTPGGSTITGWTAAEAPMPANAAADPGSPGGMTSTSVACPSASSCVMAGSYADSSGNTQALLVTGSGTSWTAANVPLPANAAADRYAFLSSVACPSASSCVAAGVYADSSGNEQALLVTGSGTSWTAAEAPLPANAAADRGVNLTSLACPSASSCVAAGVYADSSGNGQGLLVTGSGTSWTAAKAPLPANAAADPAVFPGSVACASASSCVATGTYTDSSGNVQGLLVTGSGTSWTAAKAPLPANAAADPAGTLSSVACPSASSCVAAGRYTDSSGNQQALLVTGSGSSWTAAEAPLPANAGSGADLDSVACPSASSCVAAGTYTDSSGNGQGLLVTGSGTSWTAAEAPLPANAAAGRVVFLGSVACPSASSCVAAG